MTVIAHWKKVRTGRVLCGAELLGIPVPDDHVICRECERLLLRPYPPGYSAEGWRTRMSTSARLDWAVAA